MPDLGSSSYFRDVIIRNVKWAKNISTDIISASLSLDIGQVSELTIEVDDPKWATFKASHLPLGAHVSYHDFRFNVARYELTAGGGEGGFTIVARPRVVRNLKNRKGKLVMNNVSPSRFVALETRAAGGKAICQPSNVRQQVVRDVQVPGQEGNADTSSWSTFQRLANELGFIVYESAGIIYFGKPTWLVKRNPVHKVSWTFGADDPPSRAVSIPTGYRSLDDMGRATVDVTVPIERANEFRVGHSIRLTGVPRFSDERFIINTIDYPLVQDGGDVAINATTPFNPEKEK